jgi:hypothetical protein
MDSNSLLKLTKNAINITLNSKNRPKDMNAKPGGLVNIPESLSPLIVGDLHGAVNNLKAIVKHNNNLQNLKNNKSMLIIVGDALHNDQTGQMLEMQSSLDSLEYLLQLICDFPNNVIYIRGNHDTFDDRLRKNGISQGLEFKKLLLSKTSQECVDSVENFFNALPMFIIGKGYVVTHAGPIRRGATKDEIINVSFDLNKYTQLMWNRINEYRGNASLKEYGEDDIRASIERLGLPPETYFIVGHNPLWNTGERSGVWMNVLGIKNHHIIYSNLQTQAPYFILENNEMKVKFAVDAAPEVLYV